MKKSLKKRLSLILKKGSLLVLSALLLVGNNFPSAEAEVSDGDLIRMEDKVELKNIIGNIPVDLRVYSNGKSVMLTGEQAFFSTDGSNWSQYQEYKMISTITDEGNFFATKSNLSDGATTELFFRKRNFDYSVSFDGIDEAVPIYSISNILEEEDVNNTHPFTT